MGGVGVWLVVWRGRGGKKVKKREVLTVSNFDLI